MTDPDFDGDFDDLVIAASAEPFDSVDGHFPDKAAVGWRYDSQERAAWPGDAPADLPSAWTQPELGSMPVADMGLWA